VRRIGSRNLRRLFDGPAVGIRDGFGTTVCKSSYNGSDVGVCDSSYDGTVRVSAMEQK